MKKIDKENKIFTSADFLQDKAKFALIMQIIKSDTAEIYSDEESYIICRGSVGYPAWIWTKDNIEPSKVGEITEVMDLLLTDSEKDKFTCKKEFYALLVSSGYNKINLDDYFEMGSLSCKTPKKPKECEGSMAIPLEEDKDLLVKYWYDDCREMNGVDAITLEDAEKDVEGFLASGTFFVWKDKSGKIVCMVSYNQNGDQARLNHVYTPSEERKKGYAANLIYAMTCDLLAKGLVPLLYTDYNYLPSNKAYINAGYEERGVLINFSCSRKPLRQI